MKRNKRPRLVSPKTNIRNIRWKYFCMERAEQLIKKYGYIVCEYSGETIKCLTSTFNSPDDGWGHHIDGNRNNCTLENCYIVKYKYHDIITRKNIKVESEDFQGAKSDIKAKLKKDSL